MKQPVGVCSWSLRPTSPEDLAAKVAATGLSAVQLHLDPLRKEWPLEETRKALASRGIRVLSGMMSMKGEDYSTLDTIRETGGVRLDANWNANLAAADHNAELAQELGIDLVTFHAGFLPHDPVDPLRATMIGRIRLLALSFAERGIKTALETGQEDAATLSAVLADLNAKLPEESHVGVNLDPANMILYGMGDPHQALRTLAPHVRQIHVKDATPTSKPGTWGAEVPVGTGAVRWPALHKLINELNLACPLVIEREAGEDRVRDIISANSLLVAH